MNFDELSITAAISEELLAHVRREGRVFSSGPRSHATYDTTFNGRWRIEIQHGPTCRVAIEHVGGDGAFDWVMAEADRRRPSVNGRTEVGHQAGTEPLPPPTQDAVDYRAETFEADPKQGRALLEALKALDWGEPNPENNTGRDGTIMSGSLNTEDGVRTWTTWSPDQREEPAKFIFFQQVLQFAIEHASGQVRDQLTTAGIE